MANEIDYSNHPGEKFNYNANNEYFNYHSKFIGKTVSLKSVFTLPRTFRDRFNIPVLPLIFDIFLMIFLIIPRLISYFKLAKLCKRENEICASIEQEIDRNIIDTKKDIENNIISRLHINPEDVIRRPIIICDYLVGNNSIKMVKGTDYYVRTSKYQYLTFVFTKNEIVIHNLQLNIMAPTQKESTTSTFYQDIDSMKTEVIDRDFDSSNVNSYDSYIRNQNTTQRKLESTRRANANGTEDYDNKIVTISLITTGSTKITMTIRELNSEIDASVKAVREVLRQKKRSTTDLLENIIETISANAK